MTEKRGCKSCGFPESIDFDQLMEGAEQTASDELYEQRLDLCMACPSLLYGSTCSFSGDIVHYRALFKEKSCPRPGSSVW
ncbi:DUF6171 family protein [Jeotgalibacillus sp. ET6]|uniref:DUF6171 family protein n=1 Tax=Jeotgalibacillus sp. ET6 TaxID=3037260 RepID=UPI0024189743|nr:DUF6171 family protein [Jeotgalibacillus sp. ET6]MDG5471618.1 DUF6171 family protein [Jeotgalibacillus sp. ET6]